MELNECESMEIPEFYRARVKSQSHITTSSSRSGLEKRKMEGRQTLRESKKEEPGFMEWPLSQIV